MADERQLQKELRERGKAALSRLSAGEREALLVKCWMSHDARWFAAAAGLTALLALPNLLWQAVHDFPMLELLRHGQEGKNVVLGPGEWVVQQIVLTNPVLAPLWVAGLVFTLLDRTLRFLGIASLLVMAMLIALHGKDYYGVGIYPALFAAGAVAVERWTARAAA